MKIKQRINLRNELEFLPGFYHISQVSKRMLPGPIAVFSQIQIFLPLERHNPKRYRPCVKVQSAYRWQVCM